MLVQKFNGGTVSVEKHTLDERPAPAMLDRCGAPVGPVYD